MTFNRFNHDTLLRCVLCLQVLSGLCSSQVLPSDDIRKICINNAIWSSKVNITCGDQNRSEGVSIYYDYRHKFSKKCEVPARNKLCSKLIKKGHELKTRGLFICSELTQECHEEVGQMSYSECTDGIFNVVQMDYRCVDDDKNTVEIQCGRSIGTSPGASSPVSSTKRQTVEGAASTVAPRAQSTLEASTRDSEATLMTEITATATVPVIVGSVIGGLVLVIIIIVIGILFYRSTNMKTTDPTSRRYCVTFGGQTKLVNVQEISYQEILQKIRVKFSIEGDFAIQVKLEQFDSFIDLDGEEDVFLLHESTQIKVNKCCNNEVEPTTEISISAPAVCNASNSSPRPLENLTSLVQNLPDGLVYTSKTQSSREVPVFDVAELVRVHPKGSRINEEYEEKKTLSSETRINLVSIVTSGLVKKFGFYPTIQQKIAGAKGIITQYPNLKDQRSKCGYEHFFAPEGGQSGYIQDKLKNLRRCLPADAKMRKKGLQAKHTTVTELTEFPSKRQKLDEANLIGDDEAGELVWFCRRSTIAHKKDIMNAMARTFTNRQKWIRDSNPCVADVLEMYPRFKDITDLIDQEFETLQGSEASRGLISKWEVHFVPGILRLAKISRIAKVKELLAGLQEIDDCHAASSDVKAFYAFLMLLNMLPSHVTKTHARCSAIKMIDFFLDVKPVGTSIEEYLSKRVGKQSRIQPFILCLGSMKMPSQFFIIVDQESIPCPNEITTAVDYLFKVHYIFNLNFCKQLESFYTFMETCVYKLNASCKSKISPKVGELERSIATIME